MTFLQCVCVAAVGWSTCDKARDDLVRRLLSDLSVVAVDGGIGPWIACCGLGAVLVGVGCGVLAAVVRLAARGRDATISLLLGLGQCVHLDLAAGSRRRACNVVALCLCCGGQISPTGDNGRNGLVRRLLSGLPAAATDSGGGP